MLYCSTVFHVRGLECTAVNTDGMSLLTVCVFVTVHGCTSVYMYAYGHT